MNCLGGEKGFYQDHGLETNRIQGKKTRTQRRPRTLLRRRFQKERLLLMPSHFDLLRKGIDSSRINVCLYSASGSCPHLVKSWWICGPNIFFLESEGWYSENESVRRSEGFRKWCLQMKTHVSCNLLPQVFPREMKTHCKMTSQIPVHSWGNGKHCPDEHSLANGNSSACFAPRKMLLIFMTEESLKVVTFVLLL